MNSTFYWRRAAVIAPTVSTILLLLTDFLGFSELHHQLAVIISGTFLTVAVIWWWWVMDKLHSITELQTRAVEDFIEVKQYIKETKDLVREGTQSSNRQRRKS